MSHSNLSDIELSVKGIDFLVNNDWDACEKLYKEHKDISPLMNYCSSFVSFMRATLTFEDPLLEQAQKEIEATEKLCTDQTKMFKGLKKAFGISSKSSSNLEKEVNTLVSPQREQTLEEKFTKAIIIADCKLYLALLTFIRQEVSAYLSSGILQIRRSWKAYARIQKQLYTLYKKLEPNAKDLYGSNTEIGLWLDDDKDDDSKSSAELGELTIEDDEITADDGISLEAVKRLLGAVSFGYGVFQICLSFMPPSALKLVKILGFEGDRSVALKAINFTSKSKDMRAPFADMVLLWYSTVATPLFGISEEDIRISDEDTKLILERNLTKYPESSLFFYYKGKYCRSVMRDLVASLEYYERASANISHIREIQFISIYEIGWLHLQNLDYEKALASFDILSKESKWSRSFNGYISAILSGANGNFPQANLYIKNSLKILAAQNRKKNPIELFAMKRLEYFKKNTINKTDLCELLCIELLFLWICFPYCTTDKLEKMLQVCDKITEKHFVAFKCLFEGAIRIAMKDNDFGEQCLKESIARAEGEKKQPPFGKYVLPLTHFHLSSYYVDTGAYDLAKTHLNKARDSYKDYELEDRIQTQIRSLQRRIKLLHDEPKLKEENARQDKEIKLEKEARDKNFYM